MSYAREMLSTTSVDFGFDTDDLANALEALSDCAQACTACADACLGEDNVAELRRCVRADLDCADVCAATMRVLSRQVAYEPTLTLALLSACATACKVCGDECSSHADHMDHCRVCAQACRRCEDACNKLLASAS